jgi:hypothetical protein
MDTSSRPCDPETKRFVGECSLVGCFGLVFPVPVRSLTELVRALHRLLWAALLPFVPATLALQNVNLLNDCRHDVILCYYSIVVKNFSCYRYYDLEQSVNS